MPQSREVRASRRHHPSFPESALDSRQDHSLRCIRLPGKRTLVRLLAARPSLRDPRRNQPQPATQTARASWPRAPAEPCGSKRRNIACKMRFQHWQPSW